MKEIDGYRVLFEQLQLLYPPRATELQTIQKLRGHMGHFRSSNSMWKMLIGHAGLLLQYTDGNPQWINCQVNEARAEFWNSLQIGFTLMQSEQQWRQCFRGSLIRLLPPEQRLSFHLYRISSHRPSGNFVRLSADATLHLVGGISWGDREFPPVKFQRGGTANPPRHLGTLSNRRV